MLSAPHFRSTLSLILALLFVPHTSWAEVDTAVVAKILGEELSRVPDIDDEKSKQMLNSLSNSATKLLDQNNKDWNPSSPKWKAIYDRVHADLESEMPSIRAAVTDQSRNRLQAYEANIAAHISQVDADAILAYYATPEGQRYQEFTGSVDKIVSVGAANFASPSAADKRQAVAKLTDQQIQRYLRMLMLSRLYQAVATLSQTSHDPSAGGGIGFLLGPAIFKNYQELEALDEKYAGDFASFDAFTKTDAAQHFFAAMGRAMPLLSEGNSVADSINAVEQKHESEWKALYLAQ